MKKNIRNFIPKKIYGKIVAIMPICTVDLVFLNKNKNKILLFKRKNEPAKEEYFTIGGRWHKGETLKECALSQTKEELEINLDPKKIFFSGIIEEHWYNCPFGTTQDDIDVIFGYIFDDEDINIKLDNQHCDYKWFSIKDKNIHRYVKEKIRQTLLALKK